jgi:hypothetical protein
MKSPLLIALTAAIVLVAGSGLAAMNHACKNSYHSWCASNYSPVRHAKGGRTYTHAPPLQL